MSMENLTALAAMAGVLIAAVNIIVEVLKALFVKKGHEPLWVTVVSVVLTSLTVYVYCVNKAIAVTPIVIAGSVAGGFFVAYGAMFGYEKLYGSFVKSLETLIVGGEKR